MRTITNPRDGRTVETGRTDAEAAAVCEGSGDSFARDLAAQFRSGSRPLSGAQLYWLHVKAGEIGDRAAREAADREAEARDRVSLGDVSGILRIFDRAAGRLQSPKVRLLTPGEDGEISKSSPQLRIQIAGPRSPRKGDLTIYGHDGSHFGWISKSGDFDPRPGCPDAVKRLLVEFAADPAEVSGRHGRILGRCCFCALPLSDERSTAVGYGETCAGHYGLPWGHLRTDAGTGDAVAAPDRRRRRAARPDPFGGTMLAEATFDEEIARFERQREERGFASDPDYRRWIDEVAAR